MMSSVKDEFGARINPVSINIETLEFLNDYINNNQVNSVLEFGSGVSTEFWSEKLPNSQILSFDNSRRYAKITNSRISKIHDNIHVQFAPLRRMKFFGIQYISYNISKHLRSRAPTNPFDIVFIDGPPGFLHAREATLFQCMNYIDENTMIIIDDAEREIERQTIHRWGLMFDMVDLQFHTMGAKEIATFRIVPKPKLASLPHNDIHTRWNMTKLLWTFRKRNTMHNLWLLKMKLLNREPFPDQVIEQNEDQ